MLAQNRCVNCTIDMNNFLLYKVQTKRSHIALCCSGTHSLPNIWGTQYRIACGTVATLSVSRGNDHTKENSFFVHACFSNLDEPYCNTTIVSLAVLPEHGCWRMLHTSKEVAKTVVERH